MKKQDIIRIINEEVEIALNEMYDPIYDSMIPEILGMIALGSAGVVKAVKHLKAKGLDKQSIVNVIKKAKSQIKDNINENEGEEKEYTVVYDKLNHSYEEYEEYEKTVKAPSKEEAIEKVKDMDPRGKRHRVK